MGNALRIPALLRITIWLIPGCAVANGAVAKFCPPRWGYHPCMTTLTSQDTTPYAGFWRRSFATLVDLAILAVVIPLVGYLVGLGVRPLAPSPLKVWALGNLVALLVAWAYWTFFESSSWQASPGKRLLAIMVTDAIGERLDFSTAARRTACKALSGLFFAIGFVICAFNGRKQALHDFICDSLVVCGRTTAAAGAPAQRHSRSKKRSGR